MTKRRIIEELWNDLIQSPFDVDEISRAIIMDCGVDALTLNEDDVRRLFSETGEFNWEDIAFAFGESLACYLGGDLTDHEFVRAVAVSLYLGDANDRGYGDWAFSFDMILTLMCRNMDRVNFDFRMDFFAELLRSHGQFTT